MKSHFSEQMYAELCSIVSDVSKGIMEHESSHLDGSQISSLGQNVINLFCVPFWRDEGRLFLRSLPEHRIESGVII